MDHTLVISDGGTDLTLRDVAYGDVYLCTGQSNMAFSLNEAYNASAEIADSGRYPGLRLATVNLTEAATPQDSVGSMANYTWARSSPSAFVPVGGPTGTYFSAVCYLFGRELYVGLGGAVPIGLVDASWGGVKIETLMAPNALSDDSCGGTALAEAAAPNGTRVVARGAEKARAPRSGAGVTPSAVAAEPFAAAASAELSRGLGVGFSGVWNGMIAPLLPMRFTGVAFYQV